MQENKRPIKLSPREKELIVYACEGLTDTAIALRLGISEATVGTYWGRVRIKIGPYNRTELVSIYLRAEQEEELDKLRRENQRHLDEIREASNRSSHRDDLYEQILENAPDAMLLVSESGIVTLANQMAHRLFGYEMGEINDLPLIRLIPHRYREIHQEHREEFIRDPHRRTMGGHLQTPALRKDGAEIQIRAALSALPTPAGLLVICAIREAETDNDRLTRETRPTPQLL